MEFTQFISENFVILIPFIYALGSILKGIEKVSDKYIPLILLAIGVAVSVWIGGFTPDTVINGVLCVAGATYCNQVVKQLGK